eukprot:TRINITY_DN774033_c0_g1_i1.p1 TRINITY_DN774033_c0_g1~~TRINITY_DN774033_c0_g1_i1.p1  ORF type:complete len:845 (-),score=296.42 TRINITY_DN774033_c0_g1_i1:323-2857(-)
MNDIQAAEKIQRASRAHLAKKKANAECNWRTWNTLDNHKEQLAIQRGKKVLEVAVALKKRLGDQFDSSSELDIDSIEISEEYDGPEISFPLTLEIVVEMLEHFKLGHLIHFKYAMQLLERFKHHANKLPGVQHIALNSDVKLTVVGDTHGQLQDLFSIFTMNGLPSKTNQYLFNGDFVDRGECGVEVFLTIVSFYLLYPGCVFLNRGNHESRAQNSWMGFEDEVLNKFDDLESKQQAPFILDYFQQCFDCLPLGAVVAGKIFVVHGGLFGSDINLKHIDSIKRKREIPIESTSFEDRLFEDLLWSDPRPTANFPKPFRGARRSDRGAGVEFGSDVTTRFCSLNSIALVIRSHECVQDGYEVLHDGRLITIFSASRYCGTMNNKGAFISFGSDLQPEIQQFYAHSMEASVFKSPEEREDELEEDTLAMIAERIVDHKPDLYMYYTQNDKEHTGSISRLIWAQGLTEVLALELPWLTYQPKLVDAEDDGNINYTQFLERWEIESRPEDMEWQDAVIEAVCEKLFDICSDVKEAYRRFDIDADNSVDYEEFASTLDRLDLGLSKQQTYVLMRSIDTNDDGKIDFGEFANRFQVVFTRMQRDRVVMKLTKSSIEADATMEAAEEDMFVTDALNKIGRAIKSQRHSITRGFAAFDVNKDGQISTEEFTTALKQLGLTFSPEQTQRIIEFVDKDNSGTIEYEEFVSAFKVTDVGIGTRNKTTDRNWQRVVVQQISNVFFQYKVHMRAAFRMFDKDKSGSISREEFHDAMSAINSLLDSPLSEMQINQLMNALDRDNDGCLDYKEFLGGFKIVDTNTPNSVQKKQRRKPMGRPFRARRPTGSSASTGVTTK